MALLAGMNSDDVEAGVSAASPGSSKAVRGFETCVIIREEKPCLSVRLDAGRNQGVVEDVAQKHKHKDTDTNPGIEFRYAQLITTAVSVGLDCGVWTPC